MKPPLAYASPPLPLPSGYSVKRLAFQQWALYHGSSLVGVHSCQNYAANRASRHARGLSW